MQSQSDVVSLLVEIRDSQQKLLAEYSRVANEALTIQREAFTSQQKAITQQRLAVETQLKSARLYKLVVLVAVPIVAFFIWRIMTIGV